MAAQSPLNRFALKREWGPSPKYPRVLLAEKPKDSEMIVIAGPCSVECAEQATQVVEHFRDMNVTFVRGGVYRAGTYPPEKSKYGLQRDLLRMWSKVVRTSGMRTIIEVLDIRQIDEIEPYADAFQVGARHCQDYALLTELSKSEKTVTIKRGPGMTLDEFLGAAEYLKRGRCSPILIERGSATHMNHVRWDLSISIIPAIKAITDIPVIVDASHGTGRRDLVRPMTLAGMAAGADGFLVETHPNPDKSLSDSDQAYPLEDFDDLVATAANIRAVVSL